jgi:hypothetical protein
VVGLKMGAELRRVQSGCAFSLRADVFRTVHLTGVVLICICYDLVLSFRLMALPHIPCYKSPVVRTKKRPIIYIIVSKMAYSGFTMRTGFFAPYFHQCPVVEELPM